ncbi:hypothetical protein QJS66_02780 [Kocuria rhizophila]|nr:hypothetical protein QJS66_02780 [Kocuria rhizophila]
MVQTNILTLLSCVPWTARQGHRGGAKTLGASGLSRHLATLEQLGLASRAPDPEDGRAQIVSITEAGRHALDTNLRADAENLASRLGDLSEEEAARASASLNRITEAVLDSLGCPG